MGNNYKEVYDYRPFDIRHINYDVTKVSRHRYEIMKHFVGHDNYGLVIDRQVVTDNWSHIQIVRNMIDNRCHYSRKGIPVECPMFLYDDNGICKPNVDMDLLHSFMVNMAEGFSEVLTDTPGHIDMLDLFDYCYGILNSSAYRVKYKDLLLIDFPKVPIPISSDMFWQVVATGGALRKLHLFEEEIPNVLGIEFAGDGDNLVSAVRFVGDKVFINQAQYFSGVREDVWDFCFGGYHGLQKWFKDRRQQVLSSDDIAHVIAVFNVFDQSETYMATLDDTLAQFGVI